MPGLQRRFGRGLVLGLLRDRMEELRTEIRGGGLTGVELARATSVAGIVSAVRSRAEELLSPRPRAVINGTGVIVHTNLGRSVLSERAAARIAESARGYVDLEYDLVRGVRGGRMDHLAPLMERLFPERGFLVVNNNAAAILLCLRVLARRREVLISRGELVEIGGSFRVPDILTASGAKLREVGTTNRTRLDDYAGALGPRSALVLKVHTSNFRIVGFAEETSIAELAGLTRRAGVPLVVDWGSGDLVDLGPVGIDDELPVGQVLEAGADLVTFSGDKLLGGPQAGFIVGRPDLIARLRRDPMARICRLDRLLIAALRETLAAYVTGRQFEEIPTLRMLAAKTSSIGRRAEALRRRLVRSAADCFEVTVIDGTSRSGGGSSPAGERSTKLLGIGIRDGDAAILEKRLRECDPPIIGRMQDGRVLLDLRTVLPEQDPLLLDRLTTVLARSGLKPRSAR